MVAALVGYKNKEKHTQVCKFFCIEHNFAKLDESIHRIHEIKKLDNEINDLDSFSNYRDKKY